MLEVQVALQDPHLEVVGEAVHHAEETIKSKTEKKIKV